MLRWAMLLTLIIPFYVTARVPELDAPANKEIVEQFYNAIVKQEYKTVDSLMANNYQIIDIGAVADYNRNQFAETAGDINKRMRMLHRALPGLTIKVEQMVSEGNKVVARTQIMGEQKGPFLGVAPTNKTIVLRNFVEFTIENGKISRVIELWNELGVMKQMGYIILN